MTHPVFPFDPLAWNRCALLTCAEMQSAERQSCAEGPLSLFDLMNNAGQAVARVVQEKYDFSRVLVMCGPGNNGGDGYVAAEALRGAGWTVAVGALEKGTPTPEAAQARAAWQGATKTLAASLFDEADLVIDALFGTGLQRPLEGEVAAVVAALNARKVPVVAVDIPSGVEGDTGRILGAAVEAERTVTFFRKKLGHVLSQGARHAGEIFVADIGIDASALKAALPRATENDPSLWLPLFPFPQPEGHKYSRGHALIYGGSEMTGASRLATRAAQRAGAGLVTLAVPESARDFYAAALESALVRAAETEAAWRGLLIDPKRNAVLVGPGMGLGKKTKAFVLAALATRKPLVLDAEALTVFAEDPQTLFAALHPLCVLTPHKGEFTRLFGQTEAGTGDRLTRARRAAAIAGCVILLKGAATVIASPEGLG
ncbi:MAG: NAD(P)H-hydrate epimerase, partial [Alphaproteobacteria bacterium]|nr:NAD(P)H-hydrate epimerase [Alphaproteobacteria bacterium]